MDVIDYIQFVKTANSNKERLLAKEIQRLQVQNEELRKQINTRDQQIRELKSELGAWYRFRETTKANGGSEDGSA